MKLWILTLKRRQQVSEIAERKLGIQPPRNVKLSRAFLHGASGHAEALVNVVRVSAGLARRAIKAAELAVNIANVGWVKMPIYVEVSNPSVFFPARYIRELTQGRQVVGSKE